MLTVGIAVPPTSTDSSVFIRILRGKYGYTGTMLHYTEECARRFRGQLLLPTCCPW